MANSLLKHHIEMLHLRPDAPYTNLTPRESLEEWKRECRLKLFRPCVDSDSDIPDDQDRDYSMDVTR